MPAKGWLARLGTLVADARELAYGVRETTMTYAAYRVE